MTNIHQSCVYHNEQYQQYCIEHALPICFKCIHAHRICNVDTGVHSILNSLKNIGSIEMKTRISNIKFSRAKDKQAQLQVVAASKTIHDVKLNLQKKITTHGEVVRGCCITREGDFLFMDHWRKKLLTVLASDGTLKYNMSLCPNDGYDITFVNEKHVAITSGNSGKYDSGVSVFADKIYYTDRRNQSVVCCHRNGSRVWTFKDDSVLKFPRGITVDNDGIVFVVGQESSNMLIISNDGTHHKEILTEKDGLSGASAIFFDKQKKELLVANLKQRAFLYNVT
ncbi:TRIM71 [Mytilus coruscus]|uniref:TRIM71 n=1 Tax=Mytilus coruscus TaxID=42192 RepID=A0A6J8D8A7_MYTCO|nr:TRIM71 [Mytilus coruscus]